MNKDLDLEVSRFIRRLKTKGKLCQEIRHNTLDWLSEGCAEVYPSV